MINDAHMLPRGTLALREIVWEAEIIAVFQDCNIGYDVLLSLLLNYSIFFKIRMTYE